jgi:type IV secretory pathway VirD2 relaxase
VKGKGEDDDLRVRPGRIRNRGARARPRSFFAEVRKAAQKAGYVGRQSRSGKRSRPKRSTFGRGRGVGLHRGMLFGSSRRVVVRSRIIRHRGRTFRSTPLAAHVAYLKREGVTRDGEKARMFDGQSDSVDDKAFAERCRDDRHHFRFIVSPEEATQMIDLKAFTRDLLADMERDLGTKLDWVAAEHWNTDNPHVHILIRGKANDGGDLVISSDYSIHGLRARAQELVTLELGPKTEREIRSALEKDVTVEGWTRLDRAIARQAKEFGLIDLRPSPEDPTDPELRRLMIGRLQRLERWGLATPDGAARWIVAEEAERALRDLGLRRATVTIMHRALAEQGIDRPIPDYVIYGPQDRPEVTGRLVWKGLHDELTSEAYAVIDGVDGRVHYIRFPDLSRFDHAPSSGGIVATRSIGVEGKGRSSFVLSVRSDLALDVQVTASGATWLDHQLLVREKSSLSEDGFGREVHNALQARVDHLVGEGLARRQGNRIIFARNLLDTLCQRELDAAAAQVAAETGLTHRPLVEGETIAGTYRRRLNLASGRFAMIDDGLGFSLVPWRPALERELGRQVSGILREGTIEWTLGRQRGLGIG